MEHPAPLFPIPATLDPALEPARRAFDARRMDEAERVAREAISQSEYQIPPNLKKPEGDATASAQRYHAATTILVDVLAAQERWKEAKEVLGHYRVRFPRDPWGFRAGAEVTRRDQQVRDREAVQRAIVLLEGEAQRLEDQDKSPAPKGPTGQAHRRTQEMRSGQGKRPQGRGKRAARGK